MCAPDAVAGYCRNDGIGQSMRIAQAARVIDLGNDMFKLALAAYQNGNFSAARSHLESFLESEPAHAEALHLLAVLLAQDKRLAEAEPLFLAAMRYAPDRLDFCCNYALSLHENGRNQEAVDHFLFALSLQSKLVLALNGLGNALCALGEYERAEDAFRRALKGEPANPLLHNNLGNALKERGQIKQAIASYRRALSIKPSYPEACVNLGIALKETGSLDEASALLEQALSLKPGIRQAEENLRQIASFWREAVAGRHLVLRPYSEKNAAFLGYCLGNKAFMMSYHRFLSGRKSLPLIAAHLRKAEKTLPWQNGTVDWVIFRHGEAERPVGLANLVDLNFLHRRAEFLIGIPAEEERHTGVGLEASLLVMDFAFNRARLNKLTSLVYEDNARSQKNTLALGFTQEGYRPEHLYDEHRQRHFGVYENGLTVANFRANTRLSNLSRRVLGRDVTEFTGD
jgi:diamine N-acetyltransferase